MRLDARDGAVRLGAQGKAEQRLGRAEQLGGAEEAAELCGVAELLGVPLTILSFNIVWSVKKILSYHSDEKQLPYY